MSLAAALWTSNGDLAAAALAHPFVRGIADGSLPESVFAGYVAQDAFFLESFVRGYALGVARSPDRAGLDAFADMLQGVCEELRLHAGYAARWGIELGEVVPVGATLAYTDFLLATATLADVGVLCAAMTPCMRLYAHLGVSVAKEAADRYREWVDAYSAPEFQKLTRTLERLLDRYAQDTRLVRGSYRRAMRLELAFFDAASGSGRTGTACAPLD